MLSAMQTARSTFTLVVGTWLLDLLIGVHPHSLCLCPARIWQGKSRCQLHSIGLHWRSNTGSGICHCMPAVWRVFTGVVIHSGLIHVREQPTWQPPWPAMALSGVALLRHDAGPIADSLSA
jgi:hypothetical protein